MVLSLTNVIYREFDQKQIEHEQRHDKDTDAFAVGVITELAKELNYNNGDMPELAATEPPPICRRLQSKYGWSLWKKVTEQTGFRPRSAPARFG
jgi:hypothetical protein